MGNTRSSRRKWAVSAAALSITLAAASAGLAHDSQDYGRDHDHDHDHDHGEALIRTESPLKHVIILIGENRGTDHTFGVYKPKGRGQTISNLLSKGIVKEDGSPGPNFSQAQQYQVAPQSTYYIGAARKAKSLYGNRGQMPQPNTAGTPSTQGATAAPFLPAVVAVVPSIDPSPDFGPLTDTILTTGATGLAANSLDTRIPDAGILPNGPYVLQGLNISDDDYTGDTTHRFYQAWQQSDCSIANATRANPTDASTTCSPS